MAAEGASGPSLRDRAYESGRYLVARQLAGVGLRAGGILAVTRLIGPEAYGLFAAPAAVMSVLSTIAIFGIDVHLVRHTAASETAEHTAFAMLVVSSTVVAAVAVAAAPVFGVWLGDDAVVGPMRVLAALTPAVVLWVPARARLERALEFRTLAGLELTSDVVVYLVAIPLAAAGAGVWAPVAGYAARHLWLLVATHAPSRYRPRMSWSSAEARSALAFGAGYSVGNWVSVTANLVNPLLVGRLAGPVGVGYVGLASRLVQQLGAVKQATVSLARAGLARLQHDVTRLSAAHAEGTLIQVLGSAPLLAAAAFAGPWLIPVLFGSEWAPVAELIALMGAAATVGTLFNLHSICLEVLGRNAPVARLKILQFGALAGGAAALVPWLGATGYGWARLIRTLPFALVHRDLSRVFTPRYGRAARWVAVFLPPMASPWVPAPLRPLLLVPLAAFLLSPTARAELVSTVRSALRGTFRRRQTRLGAARRRKRASRPGTP